MEYFGFDKTIGQGEVFSFDNNLEFITTDPVDPVDPEPVVGQPLSFTTTNSKGDFELPLIIRIFEPTGSWTLKESGVLVADSTGFYDETKINKAVVTEEYQNGAVELSLVGGAGLSRSYELSGKAGEIRITSTPLLGYDVPDGVVNVTSFSTELTATKLNLKQMTLIVPSVLPTQMTNLSNMFYNCNLFNQDISVWDTSHVVSMSFMFGLCRRFNQPIGNWDTSNVTDMSYLLYMCTAFNQPLNNLATSKVTNMEGMLRETTNFNQPIGNWDTSNVTSLSTFIYGATKFNQPIGMFDVSKVANMTFFAQGAYLFQQDLTKWCVRLIPSMPTGFATQTKMTVNDLPKWGTCPPRV